jgi:hypothetical protein
MRPNRRQKTGSASDGSERQKPHFSGKKRRLSVFRDCPHTCQQIDNFADNCET